MNQVLREKREWDSCLAEAGIRSVFLSREFSKLCFFDPVLFVYRRGIKVAAFVYSQDKDTARGLRYGGVIANCSDSSFCLEAASSVTDHLRAQGVRKCEIRNHPFLNTVRVGKLVKEEPFVFIDLTRPNKELVAAITKQHRRCIRRAEESGLDVMYSDDKKYLKFFYEFYKARQKQMGIQPKGYMFFDQMFKSLKDHFIIGVVREANKVLAVSILLKDSGSVFMTYGGMSDEGYERYAKHLMIFDMILKFKSKCFSRLVLGTGSNGKDSIYNFKRGFTDKESSVCTYGI